MTAGERFGRWLVIDDPGETGSHRRMLVRCDCGTEKLVRVSSLKAGGTKSCGCLKREQVSARRKLDTKHGMCGTPTYGSWSHMIQRCTNPNNDKFYAYGAKGITVCERWKSFENFLADMGVRPEGKTLDRYPDQKGNYEPGNVRWATPFEQTCNSRSAKLNNELAERIRQDMRHNKEIAKDYGVDLRTVQSVKAGDFWT